MISLRPEPGPRADLDEYIKIHQELFDALPYPSFVTDTGFNIALFSRSMNSFYSEAGKPEDIKCYQLFNRPECPQINCPLKNEKTGCVELYMALPGKHLLVHASPLIFRGRLVGALHSVTDITEIKKSEEQHMEFVDVYARVIESKGAEKPDRP